MAATDPGLRGLPSGTVTLLLADVEGSVKAWEADAESAGLARTRLEEIAGQSVARHRGARPVEQGEGDNLVVAFVRASDAVTCALDLQLTFAKESWPGSTDLRVRIALHTGEVEVGSDGKYAGPAINRCARLRDLAHGGQTLLSQAAYEVAADALPREVTLKDLGRHRLRDLTRPERVYQLSHPDLPDLFPPLRSLDAVPNNLPLQLTSFIGRETEIQDLRTLIGHNRFVTLAGSGGCGKTRLALQLAASSLEDYPDGAWWVDLAPLSDPGVVNGTVASVLSLWESESEPILDSLIRQTRDRHLMIVLDNCEHLLGPAADLASAFLKQCPGVWLVATSREPIGIEGEVSYRVPSLTFPSADIDLPGDASAYDSVRLFVERARQVRPHFEVTTDNAAAIASICRRLDGIPLAIEWAAKLIRMLGPAQIAEALAERFDILTGGARTTLPRQRTLEASLDWSFTLLPEQERTLLARLSVFAGTFTLESAEEICEGKGIDLYQVLELVSGLADKSLVQVEESDSEARYRLLETVRAYARQKLADSGDLSEMRNRHLDYYVTLAERAEPEIRGPRFSGWARRLNNEIDNLRAALEWALSSHHEEKHLRLTGALLLFWVNRGMYTEIQQSMTVALSGAAEPLVRVKALSSAALMAVMAGRYRPALELARECVHLAREIDDERSLGWALFSLGWSEFWLGEGGLDHLEEAVRLGEALEDSHLRINASSYLGLLEGAMNRVQAGYPILDEAIAAARALGDDYLLSNALFLRGALGSLEGHPAKTRSFLEESIEVARSVDDRTLVSYALTELSGQALIEGDYAGARALGSEALELAADFGGFTEANARFGLAFLEFATGNLEKAEDDASKLFAEWRGSELLWFVSALYGILGGISLARSDLEGSRRMLDEAMMWSRRSRWPRMVGEILDQSSRLSRMEGDLATAEALMHEALDLNSKYGWLAGTSNALESLAGIAVQHESYEEAVRLFGAAARLREQIAYVRFPVIRETYEADVAVAREALGEEKFDLAWTEGVALSMEEVVAYARRGRGDRKRPTVGWPSLTPTELEVAKLVAQGLSNPDIAKRLFISRNTVKVHLSHIFAKLGISSRAELAAEAIRQGV